jgi:hypothetical protein
MFDLLRRAGTQRTLPAVVLGTSTVKQTMNRSLEQVVFAARWRRHALLALIEPFLDDAVKVTEVGESQYVPLMTK